MRYANHISVIIPALNEAETLPGLLPRLPCWVDDVVVVDNGSTDATAACARANGARVAPEARRGYGAACLAGIDALQRTDIVVFLDADGSSDPGEMNTLVDPIALGRQDLVLGARVRGRIEPGAMIWTQRLGNGAACWLLRRIRDCRYTDLGPFRAIAYPALMRLAMQSPDYGWTIEMQIKALEHGLRVDEVPVGYRLRAGGASKISGRWGSTLLAGKRIFGAILVAMWGVDRR